MDEVNSSAAATEQWLSQSKLVSAKHCHLCNFGGAAPSSMQCFVTAHEAVSLCLSLCVNIAAEPN